MDSLQPRPPGVANDPLELGGPIDVGATVSTWRSSLGSKISELSCVYTPKQRFNVEAGA